MIVEYFGDYLELSNNEHQQLAAILDNYSSMQEPEYDEEFSDFFSIGMEA